MTDYQQWQHFSESLFSEVGLIVMAILQTHHKCVTHSGAKKKKLKKNTWQQSGTERGCNHSKVDFTFNTLAPVDAPSQARCHWWDSESSLKWWCETVKCKDEYGCREEEWRAGEGGRDSALPTRAGECEANGITQRSDIYSLSSFFNATLVLQYVWSPLITRDRPSSCCPTPLWRRTEGPALAGGGGGGRTFSQAINQSKFRFDI